MEQQWAREQVRHSGEGTVLPRSQQPQPHTLPANHSCQFASVRPHCTYVQETHTYTHAPGLPIKKSAKASSSRSTMPSSAGSRSTMPSSAGERRARPPSSPWPFSAPVGPAPWSGSGANSDPSPSVETLYARLTAAQYAKGRVRARTRHVVVMERSKDGPGEGRGRKRRRARSRRRRSMDGMCGGETGGDKKTGAEKCS